MTEPSTLQIRQRKGIYIVSDPVRSNVVVVGRLWKSVTVRAEKLLEAKIPHWFPPDGAA